LSEQQRFRHGTNIDRDPACQRCGDRERRRDAFRIELEKVGSGHSRSEGAKREGWMPTLVVVKV
jgi:hypothetical protein